MNRRKLGPPPSWIPASKAPHETEAGDAADPLQNIFTASRTARLGDGEDDSLLQLYSDRRELVSDSAILAEVNSLLLIEKRKFAPFAEILLAPSSNADVRDVRNTRLVLLAPAHTHAAGNADSIARKKSQAFLYHYGVGPRRYRNSLVFLAADAGKFQEFVDELRSLLAWRSLVDQPGGLEPRLVDRARGQVNRLIERKEIALREAYCWLLTPFQTEPGTPVEWKEIPVDAGTKTLAEGAAQTLGEAGLVRLDDLGLAEDIDAAKQWLGDSVPAGPQLAEEFARQLYLPRLMDERILLNALQTALAAGIKPRIGPAGPKRLYSTTIRLDQNDLARIAPQLLLNWSLSLAPWT